jgi:peptidoglycan hydrolase-like protein with peptidoglycan-binding domain
MAVKTYQRKHGLKVDAIVGLETWISLKSNVKPGVRLLREGCSGADVYELQGLLQIQGYVIKRDGVFGEETKSAVIAFQQRQHLQVTGIVNPVTWGLLGERKNVYQKRKR